MGVFGSEASKRLGVRLNVSLGCNLKMKFSVLFSMLSIFFFIPYHCVLLTLCQMPDDLEEEGEVCVCESVSLPKIVSQLFELFMYMQSKLI